VLAVGVGALEPAVDVIEREQELARIQGALDRVVRGAGSLLLVEGESGISPGDPVREGPARLLRREPRLGA
jgi:hypothetical protein